MRNIPIRVRLTIVVALAAGVALSLLAAASANTVEENVTDNTLESTGAALDDATILAVGRSDDFVAQLQEVARLQAQRDGDEDQGWAAGPDEDVDIAFDDLEAGLDVEFFDASGQPSSIPDQREPVVALGRVTCTQLNSLTESCDSELTEIADGARADRVDDRLVAMMTSIVEGQPVSEPTARVGTLMLSGDTAWLILVTSRVDSTTTSSGIGGILLLVVPALVLMITAITWVSLGGALRPVESISAQVARIGNDSLDQRVPVPPANDHLHHLASTMNQMLDRLQASRDSQRQFISDASHELRSPITATKATLEVAQANPTHADWSEVASVLEEENTRLAHLVDDLLLLAQLDEQREAPRLLVDLDEICLAEAARPHPLPVVVRIVTPARVDASATMVTRAIKNLIENATVHAQTSVGVELDLVPTPAGPMAVVVVSDDGAGVPMKNRARIFERFARVDESRNRDAGGGAGLGLAIVHKVAVLHGGTIEVGTSESGGASFRFALPANTRTMR